MNPLSSLLTKHKHFFVNNIFDMPIKTLLQLIIITYTKVLVPSVHNIIYDVRGHHSARNMEKMEKKKVITV